MSEMHARDDNVQRQITLWNVSLDCYPHQHGTFIQMARSIGETAQVLLDRAQKSERELDQMGKALALATALLKIPAAAVSEVGSDE